MTATRAVTRIDTEKRTIEFVTRAGDGGVVKESFSFEQALQQEIISQEEVEKWQRGDYDTLTQEEIAAWLDTGERP